MSVCWPCGPPATCPGWTSLFNQYQLGKVPSPWNQGIGLIDKGWMDGCSCLSSRVWFLSFILPYFWLTKNFIEKCLQKGRMNEQKRGNYWKRDSMKKCFSSLIYFFPLLFAPISSPLSVSNLSTVLHLSLFTAMSHLNHLLTFSWPDGGANVTCFNRKEEISSFFFFLGPLSLLQCGSVEVNPHWENFWMSYKVKVNNYRTKL